MTLTERFARIEGVGYTSISTIDKGATWGCSLGVTLWGDEYNYYASGATPDAALEAAVVLAEAAAAERATW